jgi:2-polyprenyl-3-methyl-5-hydroxy-6-metoxy-1,4-benzoquinol methylase
MEPKSKFEIQNSMYVFPYHYIPHFNDDNVPVLSRRLSWGLEYLCYQKHIRDKIVALRPNSVLDVGCGDGYFIGSLPDIIEKRVGIDISERAIAFARAFNPHCEFITTDITNIDEKFDVVTAIEVLEHIPDESVKSFLISLVEKVRDDGIILISVPTVIVPLNKKHYRHYTIDLLKESFDKNGISVSIKKFEYVYRKPWWTNVFQMISVNRKFCLEIPIVMNYLWKSIIKKYQFANKNNGSHLVAIIEKK